MLGIRWQRLKPEYLRLPHSIAYFRIVFELAARLTIPFKQHSHIIVPSYSIAIFQNAFAFKLRTTPH